MASASSVESVVPWVRMLRGSVSLIERFRICSKRLVLVLVQVLPDPVEDDDRVVERVADHRQQRRHDHQADLELHDADEGDGGQDVVRRGERRPPGRSATRTGRPGRPAPRRRRGRWRGTPCCRSSPPTLGPTASVGRPCIARAEHVVEGLAAPRRRSPGCRWRRCPGLATRARITNSFVAAEGLDLGAVDALAVQRRRAARPHRPAAGV